MQKQNTQRTKRVRNLVVISALMAVTLTVATYAWFIGMQSVNVTSFDVEIKTAESLLLSLNGTDWDTEVAINKGLLDTSDPSVTYTGHTNKWSKLVPMSTVGEMDPAASRLKMYEKASLTATAGGYRLMASRVDNYTDPADFEPDGYVAFDLFVRNISGTQYIEDLNLDDEEAIYLTVDSGAKVSLSGGVSNTGIENSVRVAFTQIGRVIGTTTDDDAITGIKCAPDPAAPGTIKVFNGVTGICRLAKIWEPNDRSHVEAAIDWYDTSCRLRKPTPDGDNITDRNAYDKDTHCDEVVNGTSYPTYAVSEAIDSEDSVDVYDGVAYNSYDDGLPATTFLESYPYFTDTMKLLPGTTRPEFMRLAPNSVTKIRIYIYIEGQDVDNYDFAQIGKKISINFGFTKERFIEDDIDYEGPPINPAAPVITLEDGTTPGDSTVTLAYDTAYVDPGFTVDDDQCDIYAPGGASEDPVEYQNCIDGLEAATVVNSYAVNQKVPGSYMVTYIVKDSAGNQTIRARTVIVEAEE